MASKLSHPQIRKTLHSLSPLAKSYGVTQMHIIGSYARKGSSPPPLGEVGRGSSDLDILCHWKSKQKWATNANALSVLLSSHLKIKVDLTAPFHHKGYKYDINKIPAIHIF